MSRFYWKNESFYAPFFFEKDSVYSQKRYTNPAESHIHNLYLYIAIDIYIHIKGFWQNLTVFSEVRYLFSWKKLVPYWLTRVRFCFSWFLDSKENQHIFFSRKTIYLLHLKVRKKKSNLSSLKSPCSSQFLRMTEMDSIFQILVLCHIWFFLAYFFLILFFCFAFFSLRSLHRTD